MQNMQVLSLFAPLILAFMILGMGLSLKINDFTRLIRQPKAVVLGLSLQVISLPLLGFLINSVFALSGPLAVGMMILVACPGGPGSNLLTYICRGDAALSVSLTAFSSVFALVTIPLIVNASVLYYMQVDEYDISVVKTLVAVLVITIVPLIIGMFVHNKHPHFTAKVEPKVKVASIVFLLILVVSTFYKSGEELAEFINTMGMPVILLCVSSILMAALVAKIFKLSAAVQKTISIEVGIQNSALAIVVASSLLNSNEMAIPAALYSPVMITASLLFMLHAWFNKPLTQ